MKNIKRIVIGVLLMAMLICCASFPVYASNGRSDTLEPTMGSLEDELMQFIGQNYPDIEYGSEDYMEFLLNQFTSYADVNLMLLDNYNDILLYASEYLYQLDMAAIAYSENASFSMPNAVRAQTPDQIRAVAAQKETSDEQLYIESQLANRLTSTSSSYNSTNAVSYARTWANSRNPNYETYTSDCTNFASQVLVAGGISMTHPDESTIGYGINSTTSYWYSLMYYDLYTTLFKVSSSFVNVADLYTYLVNNESVTVTTTSSLSTLQTTAHAGDIVQLKQDGNWCHTIIITGGTSGDLTYCGHTTNRLDYAVSNLTGYTGFRIIRP